MANGALSRFPHQNLIVWRENRRRALKIKARIDLCDLKLLNTGNDGKMAKHFGWV